MPSSESFWHSLPSLPGIYIFEDKNKKPLYIGKSISIKTRIKQHFVGFTEGNSKAVNFFPKTSYLYFKIVNNDLEAVITEANYIKTYQPRYNSITKDGKSNVYIVFTNPPDTKIRIIHATDTQTLDLEDYKKQVYGPFTSTKTAEEILKQIRQIFGYCNSPFNIQNRSCFYYHIQKCPGPCIQKLSRFQYQRHLGQIKRFLSGHFLQLNKNLNKQINNEIKKLNFEKAEKIKKIINSLNQALNNHNSSLLLKLSDATDILQQKIVSSLNHPMLISSPKRIECFDLAHLQGQNYVGSMAVFVKGQPETSLYRHFNVKGNQKSDAYAMKEIINRRFNHPEWGKTDLIILDGGVPQLSIVSPIIPKNIAVIALAKKRETIFFYDLSGNIKTLNLNIEDPVLNLFRAIRDEAHRFATTFHIKKRSATSLNTKFVDKNY